MTQEQIDALKTQGFTDSQLNAITTALGGPGNVGEQTPTYPTQQMGTGVTPGAYPTNELPGNSVLNNALDVMFPGINSARMWNPSVTYQEKAVSNARKPLFLQQEATYQEAQKRLGDNKLALNALEAKEQQGIPLTAEEMSQKENLTNQITADEQVSRNPSEEEIAEADKAAAKKVENAAKVGRGFGIAGSVMNSTFGAADAMLTSGLKLGAGSQMIDSGVDMASNALMKSGNPYLMACVCEGTKVWTNSGKLVNIEDLKQEDGILGYYKNHIIQQPIEALYPPSLKECVQLELENGELLRCSVDHPIYSARSGRARYITVGKKKQRRIKEYSFKEASLLEVGDFVALADSVPYFGKKHIKLAYLIGMLIGDGTYGKDCIPKLFTADPDTWKYIEDLGIGKLCEIYLPGDRCTKEFRTYKFNGLQGLLREHNIYGQTKLCKRLPFDINEWDKESCSALIAGLFDTDGCVCITKRDHQSISFCQSNLILIKQIQSLLLKFGIHSSITKRPAKISRFGNTIRNSKENYIITIKKKYDIINFYNNITLNISYKQDHLNKLYQNVLKIKSRDTSLEFQNVVGCKIKKIIQLGLLPVYNLTAGISHTYLANNIITHNTAGILKGVNFATKAFGRSVDGFNVNIDSNSYGSNLGHFEGRSGRVWENGKMERLNDQRNAQAQMALKAKNLVEDSKFEQRARQASLNDVMLANQMALAGGVDTSILAAKHGTRLKTMSDYVLARRKKLAEQKQHSLDNVQTGTEPNVIPEGALHKNKNHIDLEDITKKGIPVISTEGTPTTFEEIKQKGGEIVQHAEIEENELILNLSLTKKLEYCRDKYDETKDDKYLIYAGKLLCKELMSNTEDNTGLINDLEDKQ